MKLLGMAQLRGGYGAGALEPVAVAKDVLARCDASDDPAIWIARVPGETLLARAAALAQGPKDLPLYGIPFAVKDNIDVAGMPTTAGCPAYAYTPAESAAVVRRLEAAGAMLVGKTNLDQFATGLVGTRSPHGAPRSVFSRAHVSGGSSSGSAVAVASGLVSFSLGTDTAGSGRVPAGFNNIVGVKPTRGLVSAAGVVPACRSLDCVSVFAGSAQEGWAVLAVAQGHDAADPYSRFPQLNSLPPQFHFGVLMEKDRSFDHADGPVLYEAAIARLRALGGTPVEIDYVPFHAVALLLYQGPWVAERLAAIKDFAAAHADAMDPTVRQIILDAGRYSAVEAFEGQYRLQALKQQTDAAWAEMDLMLLPTTPGHPTVDQLAADPIGANARLGLYTNFVNFLDCSAIAIPAGFKDSGLPFGVTLIAPAFHDAALAMLAAKFATEKQA
jgi:allophanate hydrolase